MSNETFVCPTCGSLRRRARAQRMKRDRVPLCCGKSMQLLGDRVKAEAAGKLSRAERMEWMRQGLLVYRREGRRWTAALTDGEVAKAREQVRTPRAPRRPRRHTSLFALMPSAPDEPVLPRRTRKGRPFALRDLLTDPSGAAYQALLSFALECSDSFSLTLWPGWNPVGKKLVAPLAPYGIGEQRTTAWPGVELIDSHATLLHYRVSEDSVLLLRKAASPFAWMGSSSGPGDLAFYVVTRRSRAGTIPRRERHDCWLGSVAHERVAFVRPDLVDVAMLRKRVPGLKLGRPELSSVGYFDFWLEER